jgi:hypothetical protein
VFVLVTCLWATQGLAGLDTPVVCLMGACLLFLPRLGMMDWNDANKGVSWQVLLIAGGGVSLGDILLKTGAASWLANSIFHALGLAGASATMQSRAVGWSPCSRSSNPRLTRSCWSIRKRAISRRRSEPSSTSWSLNSGEVRCPYSVQVRSPQDSHSNI